MHYLFQIFGSRDSTDRDVVVFLAELPDTIAECKALCKAIVPHLTAHLQAANYPILPLNINLARLDQGYVVRVFKGTPDELNNACFRTYHHFPQLYPPQIQGLLPRDLKLKLERASRTILSVLSRTQHRARIKGGLNGDLDQKLEVLAAIDFAGDWEYGPKSMPETEIWKTIAFQIGQSLALFQGEELFSKGEIATRFPELAPFLGRRMGNRAALNRLRDQWLELLESTG